MGVQFPWLYRNTPKTNPSPAPPSVSQPVQIPETTDMFMVKSIALVGLTWFKPQLGAVNPLHIDYFRHQLAINLHFSRGFPITTARCHHGANLSKPRKVGSRQDVVGVAGTDLATGSHLGSLW